MFAISLARSPRLTHVTRIVVGVNPASALIDNQRAGIMSAQSPAPRPADHTEPGECMRRLVDSSTLHRSHRILRKTLATRGRTRRASQVRAEICRSVCDWRSWRLLRSGRSTPVSKATDYTEHTGWVFRVSRVIRVIRGLLSVLSVASCYPRPRVIRGLRVIRGPSSTARTPARCSDSSESPTAWPRRRNTSMPRSGCSGRRVPRAGRHECARRLRSARCSRTWSRPA